MRIVIDTNQLVWALARPPELATFVMAWASSRFIVVCSDELLDEYENVLSRTYIQKLIYAESLRAFRHYLVDTMEMVKLRTIPSICRDPDDNKVIATAIEGHVDYLLTADDDILERAVQQQLRNVGIQTATIDELIAQLDI